MCSSIVLRSVLGFMLFATALTQDPPVIQYSCPPDYVHSGNCSVSCAASGCDELQECCHNGCGSECMPSYPEACFIRRKYCFGANPADDKSYGYGLLGARGPYLYVDNQDGVIWRGQFWRLEYRALVTGVPVEFLLLEALDSTEQLYGILKRFTHTAVQVGRQVVELEKVTNIYYAARLGFRVPAGFEVPIAGRMGKPTDVNEKYHSFEGGELSADTLQFQQHQIVNKHYLLRGCNSISLTQVEDSVCGIWRPCETSPCGENGTCIPLYPSTETCKCDTGYSGEHCEVYTGRAVSSTTVKASRRTTTSKTSNVTTYVPTRPAVNNNVPTRPTVNTNVPTRPTVNTNVPTRPTVTTNVPTRPTVTTNVPTRPTVTTSVPTRPTVTTSVPRARITRSTTSGTSNTTTSVPTSAGQAEPAQCQEGDVAPCFVGISHYFVCVAKKFDLRACSDSQRFSQRDRGCVSETKTRGLYLPPCTQLNISKGRFYHAVQGARRKFLQCDRNGHRREELCMPRSVWDQSAVTCVHRP